MVQGAAFFMPKQDGNYWLIPPDVYEPLDKEFGFDFDPCPYPKPEEFSGILADWGQMNWVNPPFHPIYDRLAKKDVGPTAFIRKAIAEQQKGKSSFIVVPTQSYINLLLGPTP